MNKLKALGVSALVVASSSAFAEGTDIATAVSDFQTTTITSISTIGVAMITVGAVAIGFRWAKAALFG